MRAALGMELLPASCCSLENHGTVMALFVRPYSSPRRLVEPLRLFHPTIREQALRSRDEPRGHPGRLIACAMGLLRPLKRSGMGLAGPSAARTAAAEPPWTDSRRVRSGPCRAAAPRDPTPLPRKLCQIIRYKGQSDDY